MKARVAARELPKRGEARGQTALRPSRPLSETASPSQSLAVPDMDARIESARRYGHRLSDLVTAPAPVQRKEAGSESLSGIAASSQAPIQCFWPLSSLARMIGIGGEDEPESELAPLKLSVLAKHGETHKPIKLKEKDEVFSKPLLSFGEESPEPQKETPKTESPQENLPPLIDVGPTGLRPGSYTSLLPPVGSRIEPTPKPTSQTTSKVLPDPFKTKVNWLDFSVGGVEREAQAKTLAKASKAEKEQGTSYTASLLRGTYSRETLGGSGKDSMYKVGRGESLSGQMLHAKGKREKDLVPGSVKGHLKGEALLGGLESGYEGGAKLDWEKDPTLSLGLRGTMGAYAAKGAVGGGLDFRIPFTNAKVSLGAKGEAAYGLGVGGEASFKASKKGLRATVGAKLVSGLGFGGGLSFGVSKFDPEESWFGGMSEEERMDQEYLKALPPKGTPNRWKGVPQDVKDRLRKKLR